MAEVGNYFMIVTADSEGVLDRTFRDIAQAAMDSFLVVLKIENAGVIYYPFLVSLDIENLTVAFGEFNFVAEDIDGYPVISE